MARGSTRRTSIRSILRWSLVLVVGVPFLPLGFLTVHNFRRDLERVESEIQSANRQVALLAAAHVEALVGWLPAAAALGAQGGGGLPPASRLLAWEEVDTAGVVTASQVAPERVGRDAGFGAFLAARGDGSTAPVSSPVDRWIASWPPTVLLRIRPATPARPALVAVVRPGPLHDHVHVRIGQHDDHRVYVIDRNGRPLFHCIAGVVERGDDAAQNPPMQLFRAGGEGPIRYISRFSSRERLGHVVRVRRLDWGVVVSADVGTRVLGLRTRYLTLLWSIGFAFAAAVAIFVWTSRRLVRPLLQIRDALQREDRPAHAPLGEVGGTSPITEYAELVAAFDGLARRLAATEQELIHAEKTTLLGQLASGIAHEVGTPLNVMSGYAQFLKRRLATDPETVAVLDKIVKQTERLAELVRRVMDFARPNPEQLAPVDLGEVVRQALEMIHNLTRNVRVEVEHNPRLPPVLGNAPLLEHALLNLVVNAVHACEARHDDGRRDEARIRISTGLLAGHRGASHDDTPWVFCRVRDNGVGIPAENIGKIFQPFFTTKSQGHGTGLGLAIVERIVQQHRGEIEVESEPGVETTFTLLLPRAGPTGSEPAAPPAPAGTAPAAPPPAATPTPPPAGAR